MKKIEKSSLFLKEHLSLFQCPICQNPFTKVGQQQLICSHQHSFNLSKKGTVHFLMKPPHNEYDTEMLQSRRKIAQDQLWHPLLKAVLDNISNKEGTLLDVGCGEGSHLHHLFKMGLRGTQIGFDISKDAIQLAAAEYTEAFWCVADLAHSPFAAQKYDTILNILSPSNYMEFDRLMKEGGQLIKAVPGEQYLKEIRELSDQQTKPYSNEDVVNKFYEHFPDGERINVQYEHELDKELIPDLLEMTPLGWRLDKEVKQKAINQPFTKITVDMVLLVGTK